MSLYILHLLSFHLLLDKILQIGLLLLLCIRSIIQGFFINLSKVFINTTIASITNGNVGKKWYINIILPISAYGSHVDSIITNINMSSCFLDFIAFISKNTEATAPNHHIAGFPYSCYCWFHTAQLDMIRVTILVSSLLAMCTNLM